MCRHAPDAKLIFLEAVENYAPEERSRYLDEACHGDHGIRGQVEALLQAYAEPNSILDGNGPVATIQSAPTACVNHTIGPYKLREQIGEGGMGLVFVAEQMAPVRRQVALKVCKPGMDTKEVMGRFEAERQALALMDHPNIAKVFDAGTTDSGRPYFVMELVRGIPITEYCEQAKLGTRERLKLFITVCQAVQHAHLKGIIHRDIKPSNVMVTLHDGVPVPKVIDFGVAKAVGQRLTEQTVYTQYAQLIGTPLYMSPEQAEFSGLDIDTRTDVYSLGVLLYELLTGTTPFERQTLAEKGLDEFRRLLRETDPPRPSAKISTLAAAAQSTLALTRGLDPRHLTRSLKGELDWIVMKALEKDRNRRYESASEFAADVQRYLDDEPVTACPPSLGYRLQKLIRRHKGLLSTTAMILATLVVGTIISAWLAVDATSARRLADRRLVAEQQAVEQMQTALQAKDIALKREWETNQRVYPMNIASANELLTNGSIEAAANILRLQIPATGAADRRGFAWHYLWGLCQRRGQPLEGHTAPVYCVSFSPDSRLLATASGDHTVRLWDTETANLQRVLEGHSSDVNCVAFSPTENKLATASEDHTVGIWDAETGSRLFTLRGHADMVNCVVYAVDGTAVFSGGVDGELRSWDAATGAPRERTLAHHGRIHSVSVSSDGSMLATCGSDSLVKVWDLPLLNLRFSFENGIEEYLQTVAFQPRSDRLVAGFRTGWLRRWNAHSGREIDEREIKLLLFGIAFTPDGQTLATPAGGGSLVLWNIDDFHRQAVYSLGPLGRGCWCAAFSPDGRFLAAGDGEDATLIRMNHPPNYVQPAPLDAGVQSLAVAPDSRTVLVGCSDGTLRSFDLVSGDEVSREHAHTGGVTTLEFAPDGTRLVTGGGDRQVWIREANTHRKLRSLSGFTHPIRNVAFSVDSRKLAACDGSQVKVWETTNWNIVDEWPANGVEHLRFSFAGGVLMGGTSRPQIRETDEKIVPLHLGPLAERHLHDEWRGRALNAMAVTRDGKQAACGIDRLVNPAMFDLARFHDTGINYGTDLGRHRNHHTIAVAFTSDGHTLAVADNKGWLALYDVRSGIKMLTRSLSELTGLADFAYEKICLDFADDDSALVCGLTPALDETHTEPHGVIFIIHAPRLRQPRGSSLTTEAVETPTRPVGNGRRP